MCPDQHIYRMPRSEPICKLCSHQNIKIQTELTVVIVWEGNIEWKQRNGKIRRRGFDEEKSPLICTTMKLSTSKTGRQATKAGETSLLWKIKNVMTCLLTNFRGDSQTAGNSPMHTSIPTLKPTNQHMFLIKSADEICTA